MIGGDHTRGVQRRMLCCPIKDSGRLPSGGLRSWEHCSWARLFLRRLCSESIQRDVRFSRESKAELTCSEVLSWRWDMHGGRRDLASKSLRARFFCPETVATLICAASMRLKRALQRKQEEHKFDRAFPPLSPPPPRTTTTLKGAPQTMVLRCLASQRINPPPSVHLEAEEG